LREAKQSGKNAIYIVGGKKNLSDKTVANP